MPLELASERIRRPPHPELTRGSGPILSEAHLFKLDLRREREATSSRRMLSLNLLFRDVEEDGCRSSELKTNGALASELVALRSVCELIRLRPKGAELGVLDVDAADGLTFP